MTTSVACGDLPSSDALWNSILTSGARAPAFRVVRAGETTGRKGVTRAVSIGNQRPNDVVDANAVIERYRRGDTIVLQALHHTNADLSRLVTNLSLALDQPTQVNAYLSPPGDQGLDIHFDYHDVIVVQLSGTKTWRIWDPLPRSTNPVRTSVKVAPIERDELGTPKFELTLTPGDVVYLPRGFPHVATTTDEASEHLTIGITAIGWHRVVKSALDAAIRDGAFREAVPPQALAADDPFSKSAANVPSLDPIVTAITQGNSRHWMAQQVWRRMPQTRLRPRHIPPDLPRRLRFTPGPLLWLTSNAPKSTDTRKTTDARKVTDTRKVTDIRKVIVGLGDRLLEFPVDAEEFLHELFGHDDTIDVDSLDHLDPNSRRVLLNRLIAVGVLASADND